jgi:ABC-type multidrug transport system permease subunit
MALAGSAIAAWDNSTRGLDAASALEFTKALRLSSKVGGTCHAVAIYQASQAIYDLFDKAIVLYEGRQIYYGSTDQAREYFQTMGYHCPSRQTTGDFLTSVTNAAERKPKEGFETKVPRTPDEFAEYWQKSDQHAALQKEIQQNDEEFPIGQGAVTAFEESHQEMQSGHTRKSSPYLLSHFMQIKLCMKRSYQRTVNDKTATVTIVCGQIIMGLSPKRLSQNLTNSCSALIIGSIFYGTVDSTASFFSKGAVLFFAILLNALIAITEINTLYSQRPIVEKQAS